MKSGVLAFDYDGTIAQGIRMRYESRSPPEWEGL